MPLINEERMWVLTGIQNGHDLKTIAAARGVSWHTVNNLARKLRRDFGVTNKTRLIVKAMALGILE